MTWESEYKSKDHVVFNRTFDKNLKKWCTIWDWCNNIFQSFEWEFWYIANKHDIYVVVYFEIFNEKNITKFVEEWLKN